MQSIPRLPFAFALPFVLAACINMPTPTNQITGMNVSTAVYEPLDCGRLVVELDSLNRRESQLNAAQEQRLSSSRMQAFWWGFGQGDGIEAAELASVRGQIEAVTKTRALKSC